MLRGSPTVAIVDFGVGNLFSIRQACSQVGLQAETVNSANSIRRADAVILPGVGAFRNAMTALRKYDLVQVLNDTVEEGKPLLGICLGMQLLMDESTEFGLTPGLGLIPGTVRHFNSGSEDRVRVPQISWNTLSCGNSTSESTESWSGTILDGVKEKEFMYFVHAFYVLPNDGRHVLARTTYGPVSYCSVIAKDNVVGCQFHPERSGQAGLAIYRNWARVIAGDDKKN